MMNLFLADKDGAWSKNGADFSEEIRVALTPIVEAWHKNGASRHELEIIVIHTISNICTFLELRQNE